MVCISGCAATLVQTADTQYVDRDFDAGLFDEYGVGMLPVGGVERVSRAVITAAADSLMYFSFPEMPFMGSKEVVKAISDNGLAEAFTRFSQGVDETGFVDPSVLSDLYDATRVRYFIRLATDRLAESKRYTIEKNSWTGRNQLKSYDRKSIRVFGQVWDAETGETVWEGTGSAKASEGQYFYIAQDEADFYAAAARTVLRGMLGIEEIDDRHYPAEKAWVVDKNEKVPEYDFEYNGLFYSIVPCASGKTMCYEAEIYEPLHFERETPYQGLVFRETFRVSDPGRVQRTLMSRIDRYLGRKPADQDAATQPEESPEPEPLTEVACTSPGENADAQTMVIISAGTPIYEQPRSYAPVLAVANAGITVITYRKKTRYTEICFNEGRAWIRNDRLGRIAAGR